jgi:translation initiation factor 5B
MSEFNNDQSPQNVDSEDANQNKKKKNKKNKSKPVNKPQSAMAKLILGNKKLQEDEELRIKAIEEEEERKRKLIEEQEIENKRKEDEKRELKRKTKQDKINVQKQEGTYKTKSEKEKYKKNQERLEEIKKFGMVTDNGRIIIKQNNIVSHNDINNNINEEEEEEEEDDDDDDEEEEEKINFRCPIFTIVGHVDTGKTTLLDFLRKTTVQSHEVGGITQQIGTTSLSKNIILKQMELINKNSSINIQIPGLLLVDTPGHEAFKNLRKLGSKLADIALIIVDIMHGLEPQTIESIKLLTESDIPFMFVFNKIDRLYGWENDLSSNSIEEIINTQNSNTRSEFDTRFKQIQTQIMTLGLNCELGWKNTSPKDTINIIPVSAISGQGIPNLLKIVIDYSQTVLKKQIEWISELECIVMEITNIVGYGYTLDCVIKNGQLSKGDYIKIQTQSGQTIITKIKNIVTIPDNKDSKSTTDYISHNTIKESCGIKIIAENLEKIQIGSKILLGTLEEYNNTNNVESVNCDAIELDSQGISIYTSSQGSLESIVEYVRSNTELINPIKISHVSIGTINKKDLVKFYIANHSNSILEYMCILAFEVKIDPDAIQYAKDNKITILKDETIYRLFNQYKEFALKLYNERKENARLIAIFPCVLKIIESNVFNKKNPLIMGVDIQEGDLHLGTPLIILPSNTFIGRVISIQSNKQDVNIAKTGQSVCIKIDNASNPSIAYGRHFTHKDLLYSNITRASVDVLKEYFKKDLSKSDIALLIKLKKLIKF